MSVPPFFSLVGTIAVPVFLSGATDPPPSVPHPDVCFSNLPQCVSFKCNVVFFSPLLFPTLFFLTRNQILKPLDLFVLEYFISLFFFKDFPPRMVTLRQLPPAGFFFGEGFFTSVLNPLLFRVLVRLFNRLFSSVYLSCRKFYNCFFFYMVRKKIMPCDNTRDLAPLFVFQFIW